MPDYRDAVISAARAVAAEPEGHRLPGDSALYVKLLSLDEALARLDNNGRDERSV